MTELLLKLKPKERRGSKPRCHMLTHGPRAEVAGRLTRLVEPWGTVSPGDEWMPQGFDNTEEAQLHDAPQLLGDGPQCHALESWWLAVAGATSRTPNWDIATTCTAGGRKGLLLIEAKAHVSELKNESKGKLLATAASDNSRLNHQQIGQAITDANIALSLATGSAWALDRDRCYQMSNRFAWACKLASLGFPVILVYLGFIQAIDMNRPGETPIESADHWHQLVIDHARGLVPAGAWESKWDVDGTAVIPLIRSMTLPLIEQA